MVERGVEELDQARALAHEPAVYGFERARCARRLARAGQHRPTLRQRINLTFRIGGRAERFAIIEVSAAIPLAIPRMGFNVFTQPFRLFLAVLPERFITTTPGKRGKLLEHIEQEKCQPDTLALAAGAHE